MKSTNECRDDLFILCTHSKTGSTWIASVIVMLAEVLGKKVVINKHSQVKADTWLLWHDHSKINFNYLRKKWPKRKIHSLHISRNPLDVLIQGTRFNLKHSVAWNSEARFRAKQSYRDGLLKQESFDQQVHFEYSHVTSRILKEMANWQPKSDKNLELKYEMFRSKHQSFEKIWSLLKLNLPEKKIARALLRSSHHHLEIQKNNKDTKAVVRKFEPSLKLTSELQAWNKFLLKKHKDVFIRYGYIKKK